MEDVWTRAGAAVALALALGLAPGCGSDASVADDDDDDDVGAADAREAIDAPRSSDGGGMPDGGGGGETVRFIAMGDTGEGNEDQRLVAIAIRDLCAAEGCDFVILLGDNFYDSGVDSVDDPQWQTKFEEPYADVDLPFYAVLGNHDYGGTLGGGMGDEFEKGPIEVMYSDVSDKWIMPDTHYTFTWGNVGFIGLDTNSILWANTDNGDQRAWYSTALMEVADAEWIFAAGHHPYLSNGAHGNAGNYESIEVGGIEIPNPLPILNGAEVESFFDDLVCGTVDVYFSGHDHNRQWINEPSALCGTEMIVSGAGAKVKGFDSSGNEVHYADAETEGFFYVVVEGDTLTGRFYDKTGAMNYERVITR